MLDDVRAYSDWLAREQPSEQAIKAAVEFIATIGHHAWAYPSYPDDVSGQPHFEVRAAEIAVSGESAVYIRYRRTYANEQIDLVYLTTRHE